MKKVKMERKYVLRRRALVSFIALVVLVASFAIIEKSIKSLKTLTANTTIENLSSKSTTINGVNVSLVSASYDNETAVIKVKFVNNTDSSKTITTSFEQGSYNNDQNVKIGSNAVVTKEYKFKGDGVSPLSFIAFSGSNAAEYKFGMQNNYSLK